MLKYILFLPLVFLLNSCVSSSNLNIDEEKGLIHSKKISTFDYCTNFSYISSSKNEKYGNLFFEYINLNSSCKWNGLQRGYFVDLFKSSIKAKSFELLERIEYENIEFNTYLINNNYYVNIINKYTIFEDLFIIDYDGIYTDEQIKKYNKHYQNNYLDKKRFISNYSKSLVRLNFINSYFSKESERYED